MKSEQLKEVIDNFLSDREISVITFKSLPNDVFEVEIDSLSGVTIEECTEISRHVNGLFPDDDYELTIASYSISLPFISSIQYEKNVGRDVEVITNDGEKIKGALTSYSDESFTVEYEEMVAVEGKKRKEKQVVVRSLTEATVKSVKLLF